MKAFDIKTRQQHKTGGAKGGPVIRAVAVYAVCAAFWLALLSVFSIRLDTGTVLVLQLVPTFLWGCVCAFRKGRKTAGVLVLAAAVLAAILERNAFAAGLKHMADQYISLRNVFYSSSQPLFEEPVHTKDLVLTILLLQVILTFFFAVILRMRRLGVVTIILLFLPVLLEATVGQMPSTVSFWTVAGAAVFYFLVYRQREGRGLKKELFPAAFMFAALCAAAWLVQPVILKVRDKNKGTYVKIHDDLVDAQRVDLIDNLVQTVQGNTNYAVGGIGKGDLRNLAENHPQGTKDMEIVLDRLPGERIYLKAYVGSEYDGRKWKEPSRASFQKMLKKLGGPVEEGTILGEPYRRVEEGKNGLISNNMELKIAGASTEFAYTPYYAGVPENEAVYADAYVRGKGMTKRSYSFYQRNQVEALDPGSFAKAGKVWEAYEDYVQEEYRSCPEHLEQLEVYASSLMNGSEEELARQIDKWFQNSLTYSLEPGPHPQDKDFVEYFLMEGRKGFCVHFATAAALIYRYGGYASRYVEGYAVPADAFEEQEDGTYRAVVSDKMAHAWCETFDPDSGWKVREHTLPYAEEDSRTDPQAEEENHIEEQKETVTQPEQQETNTTGNQQDTPPVPETEDKTVPQYDKVQEEEKGADSGAQNGRNAWRGKLPAKAVLWLGAVLGIAILAAFLSLVQREVRMQKKKYRFRLKAKNQGLQNIYHEVCRIALFAGQERFGKAENWGDRKMLEWMKTHCGQLSEGEWEWMYDCAERAVFAEAQIEKKEIQKMYQLYGRFRKQVLGELKAGRRFLFLYVRGL